jgi:zinc transport system substrate-binding protein
MSLRLRRTAFLVMLFASVTLSDPGAQAAGTMADGVVVSIKPLHSLIARVMDGIGTPHLIVTGAASPHAYSLRPSDAVRIERARVLFWAGPTLETFLTRSVATLGRNARVVALSTLPGLAAPASRDARAEPHDGDAHGHDDGHGDHAHGGADPHVWLNPDNAKRIGFAAANVLAEEDPDNAARYTANAKALAADLDALGAEVAAHLASVRTVPFVVFHDAYRHFEARFGLTAASAITLSPETRPGARRLGEVRAAIVSEGVACVFAEPQFSPALVKTVIEGTGARAGVLDPLGAALEPGPGLYAHLIRDMAAAFGDCLSAP